MADASAMPDRRRMGRGGASVLIGQLARIDFKLGLGHALLWGVAVTALETAHAVDLAPDGVSQVQFYAALLIMWTTRAAVLAWTAQLVEGILPARWIVLIFVVECLGLSMAWDGVIELAVLAQRVLGVGLPLRANAVYNLWVVAAYGAPFFWFCLVGQRLRRAGDLLARAAIERSRTEAMLHDAQFEALKGRVDPMLLYRAIAGLRALYAGERERAEVVLDALVGFLRRAMPGVRLGRSTLLTELALLRAYAHLLEQLDRTQPLCRIDEAMLPADPPFPTSLLVPLVERLRGAQAVPGVAVSVELTADAVCAKLVLKGAVHGADWLGEELTHGLERTLQALCGNAGRWTVGGAPALTLWLPLPPTAHFEERDDERER
jgi:hypothetical protein